MGTVIEFIVGLVAFVGQFRSRSDEPRLHFGGLRQSERASPRAEA
ncbi:MAG: hypothetical protein ACRDRL_05430 [Sciscionella sp.]